MRTHPFLLLLLLVSLALSPAPVRAGVTGVGAATGNARSLAANPAAAVGSDGTEISAEYLQGLVWFEYQRAPYRGTDPENDPDRTFDRENREFFPYYPYFAVRSDLRLRGGPEREPARFGVGLSVSVPTSSGVHLADDSAGRYHMIDARSYAMYVNPVVAVRAGQRLTLGAGPVLAIGKLAIRLRKDLAPNLNEISPGDPPYGPETALLEGEFEMKDATGYAPTVAAGFLYDVNDRFRVGASYVAGTRIEQHGRSRFTPSLDFNVYSTADFTYTQYLPPIANAGARYRVTPEVELSLEGYWAGWSTNATPRSKIQNSELHASQEDLEALLQTLEINEGDLVEGILDRDQVSQRGYHDGWNLVAGADVHHGSFRTRGEFGFSRGAVPDPYVNAGNFDFNSWIFTVGTAWEPRNLPYRVGLSWIQYFPQDRVIDNSRFRSDASPDSGFALPSGNGTYRAKSMRIALTTGVVF